MTLQIKWLGHSWFRIDADGAIFHFDPLSEKYRKQLGLSEKLEEGAKADFILVSHSHGDHWDSGTINSLRRPDTVVIAPRKPANRIDGAVVIEAGQTLTYDKGSIRATPAYNLRKIYHRRGKGVGYLVSAAGRTIYHAGDTDFIPEMSTLGKVDVALLPIGGRFTMDANEAALAAKSISPRLLIPMHNLSTNPGELGRLLEDQPHIRVEPLKPGETFVLKDD